MCVNSARTVLGGPGDNWCMVEMVWHRRETRRGTEKTKIDLEHWEEPGYSTKKLATTFDFFRIFLIHKTLSKVLCLKEKACIYQQFSVWQNHSICGAYR